MQLEFNEKAYYESLSDDLHYHAKILVKETYEKSYFYSGWPNGERPDLYAFSKNFERVGIIHTEVPA